MAFNFNIDIHSQEGFGFGRRVWNTKWHNVGCGYPKQLFIGNILQVSDIKADLSSIETNWSAI